MPEGLGSNPGSKKLCNLSDPLSLRVLDGNNHTHTHTHTRTHTHARVCTHMHTGCLENSMS